MLPLTYVSSIDEFHGTRFIQTSFYIDFMLYTSLCKGMRSPCKQRKEVMIKLASVFHTEASQREPPDLGQFSSSHEIQPYGISLSQDKRRNHERSETNHFLTQHLEQEFCPGCTPIPSKHAHPFFCRWHTLRESTVNA